MADSILVGRLQEVYWPKWLQDMTERRVRKTTPFFDYLSESERFKMTAEQEFLWDLARTHHFVLELESGAHVEPIEVDNVVYPFAEWGPPTILDGNHRFAAHVLLRRRRIEADCGGLVSTADWLSGKIRTKPRELL